MSRRPEVSYLEQTYAVNAKEIQASELNANYGQVVRLALDSFRTLADTTLAQHPELDDSDNSLAAVSQVIFRGLRRAMLQRGVELMVAAGAEELGVDAVSYFRAETALDAFTQGFAAEFEPELLEALNIDLLGVDNFWEFKKSFEQLDVVNSDLEIQDTPQKLRLFLDHRSKAARNVIKNEAKHISGEYDGDKYWYSKKVMEAGPDAYSALQKIQSTIESGSLVTIPAILDQVIDERDLDNIFTAIRPLVFTKVQSMIADLRPAPVMAEVIAMLTNGAYDAQRMKLSLLPDLIKKIRSDLIDRAPIKEAVNYALDFAPEHKDEILEMLDDVIFEAASWQGADGLNAALMATPEVAAQIIKVLELAPDAAERG